MTLQHYAAFSAGRIAGRRSRNAAMGSPERKALAADTKALIAALPDDCREHYFRGMSIGMTPSLNLDGGPPEAGCTDLQDIISNASSFFTESGPAAISTSGFNLAELSESKS